MVRDSIVWPVVSANLLAEISRAFLILASLLLLCKLLFTVNLIELLLESVQRSFFILRLLSELL